MVRNPSYSPSDSAERLNSDIEAGRKQAGRIASSIKVHAGKLQKSQSERTKTLQQGAQLIQEVAARSNESATVWQEAVDYTIDAAQRMALTLDVLRERGNNDLLHEEAGTPPVLDYAYTVIMDGSTMPRPVNYQLLRIEPHKGVKVFDWKRPYMIIDPRAGHGAGIGGFKPDSQVGVALRAGHPVYFVVFKQHPEPEQTLADVMRAEAEFLREIARRHPKASKPVVIGNCQGGWATLLLSATHPDLTGPLVINGAPVATWSGQVGENPMRYKGGLAGGVVPAMLASDLGAGKFDGAHLVSNFESLNPSRNYFGKYYDLFSDVEGGREAFLEFERWWGGYHFTNESEIRWIVEQLFIGNRLARGEAQLEPGLHVDLRNIKSPIIVFASRGDNITPPQQALNWIADTFSDEHEIRVRGQRIIYMVHEKVGHLGIFVSSSIARKEHAEVSSTLKTIESLAPGLYEMRIDDVLSQGEEEHFVVSFHERSMSDILEVVPNDRDQEKDFASVARLSEFGADVYEMTLRPIVQSLVSEPTAEALRNMHPSRVSRKLLSDSNPLMPLVKTNADLARKERKKVDPENPFLALEHITAKSIMQGMDFWRDLREAQDEMGFLTIYGLPAMHWLGASHSRTRTHKDATELRELPDVQRILACIKHGDIAAALIRMLILLAESRGSVRRDRLERSSQVLTTTEPFKSMGTERRAVLIREQSIIVEFEPISAMETLPSLLPTVQDRQTAIDLVHFIVGDRSEMESHSLETLESIEKLLEVKVSGHIASKAAPVVAKRVAAKKVAVSAKKKPATKSPVSRKARA